MVALTLPRLHWGDARSEKKALMVHGLGSSAQTCWQVMEALAQTGWSATAIDLRGHGLAPRASNYRIADFAEDLLGVRPDSPHSGWDVVLGHSIGAASAVVASIIEPAWADKLVLLDPALRLDDDGRAQVHENQLHGHLRQDVAEVSELNPHWHPLDQQLKVSAHRQASLFALEHAVLDNDPWDVTEQAYQLSAPTLVLSGEESHGGMFFGDYATGLVGQNRNIQWHVIAGAGHSLHRDKPADTIARITEFLS